VISGLGFDRFKTILIGLPGPGIQFTTIWVRIQAKLLACSALSFLLPNQIGVIACKIFPNQRGVVQTLLLLVPLTGVIILKKLPYENSWGLVGGCKQLSSLFGDPRHSIVILRRLDGHRQQ
jgi:ACS family allantoate permease-like MFS transporter